LDFDSKNKILALLKKSHFRIENYLTESKSKEEITHAIDYSQLVSRNTRLNYDSISAFVEKKAEWVV